MNTFVTVNLEESEGRKEILKFCCYSFARKPDSRSEIKRIFWIFKRVISHSLLLSSSKCKGFTSISEDSSEISFLLVENYNYDHSLWSSDRMGIFGQYTLSPFSRTLIFSLLAVLYGWP